MCGYCHLLDTPVVKSVIAARPLTTNSRIQRLTSQASDPQRPRLSDSIALAEQVLDMIKQELRTLGLEINPDKTCIVDSRHASFSFLGFEFHPDRIAPDGNNIAKLRDGIAALCNPHVQNSWESRIVAINSLLRSFAWYYHQTDSRRLFWTLDQSVSDSLVELEAQIGAPQKPWREQIVRMSRMREVSWRGTGKSKRKTPGWNGYGN